MHVCVIYNGQVAATHKKLTSDYVMNCKATMPTDGTGWVTHNVAWGCAMPAMCYMG